MKRFIVEILVLGFIFILSACAVSVPTYNVTYVDYDESMVATYSVNQGEEALVPLDPTREGYTFIGWSRSPHNITEDTIIQATYKEDPNEEAPEDEVIVEDLPVLVVTYLEGIEPFLDAFLIQPFDVVESIEDVQWADYARVLVLYEDALRRDLPPRMFGRPSLDVSQLVTFTNDENIDVTVIYLKTLGDFERFFETVDASIFEIRDPQSVYDFYPLEGITVVDASEQFATQRLLDALGDSAVLVTPEDTSDWLYTSEEIIVFLSTTIPSFLAPYEDEINALNQAATVIQTDRGQRLIVGRALGEFAGEYYESFIKALQSGITGLLDLSLSPPEGITLPQERMVSAEVCYTEELRGLKYPTNLPHEVTLSHDIPFGRLPSKGRIVGLNVMISFNEYPSTIPDEDFRRYILEGIKTSDQFYAEMSNGQVSFQWINPSEVIYVPFFLDPTMTPDNPDYEKRIDEHIALVVSIVEETVDLTDVDLINFFWAPGLPDNVYGGLSALPHERMDTQRGNIYNYNVKKFEMRYIDDPVVFARNIYHGMGHNFGLSDIYVQQWVPEFRGKPPNYKYGNWDMMTSAINELNAWHRWILSWVDDDEVHCILPAIDGEHKVFLEPLNENEGETRMVVIPLSDAEVIYIELRGPGTFCPKERWRSFNYPWLQGGCTQNVLVTHLNTMVGNGHGPMQILRPDRSTEEDYSDALLLEGEFVTYQNITITHSERHGLGSIITIKFD